MEYCRKCLTKDLDWDNYFVSMHQYIERIEEELKADAATYQSRLDICLKCNKLLDAMCRGCGCYVELRAAMKKNHCPYQKW